MIKANYCRYIGTTVHNNRTNNFDFCSLLTVYIKLYRQFNITLNICNTTSQALWFLVRVNKFNIHFSALVLFLLTHVTDHVAYILCIRRLNTLFGSFHRSTQNLYFFFKDLTVGIFIFFSIGWGFR